MQSECFVCSNVPLICAVYEAALSRGYEAHYEHADGDLWFVEVFCIGRFELEQIVVLARLGAHQLPLALA